VEGVESGDAVIVIRCPSYLKYQSVSVGICRGGEETNMLTFEFLSQKTQKTPPFATKDSCKLLHCVAGDGRRWKGYHLCETYTACTLPSCRLLSCITNVRPDDFTIDQGCEEEGYGFGQASKPPSAGARVFVSLRSHVCVPRAPSIQGCLCWSLKLGRMMRWQGGISWAISSW
jgi:hypothetical protein